MKKLFLCMLPLFILIGGCGSDSESKGKIIGLDELDQEKAREAILDGVIELTSKAITIASPTL
ncbi:hypothetical protein JOC34_000241 [Virgibacillus halotolerans]|uniref:hypothetical protein n=1 Tax=Virgibacillus halotolerans TaxID=1071053 RepID=UPI00195F71D2|nr:hypothetical protein [Virgibacillus halotolerans]MBM7597884.1 hypothetical protein [Virgibacillus halotolerans]